MKKQLLNIIQFIVFLGLGVFLVWWSLAGFSEEDKAKMLQSFKEADYIWLLLSVTFAVLSHVSRSVRWQMLLEPVTKRPSFGNAFSAVMINYLANLAFPRLGEITRCAITKKYEDIPVDKAFGTVITERVIDLLILATLCPIVILTQFDVLGGYFNEKVGQPLLEKINNLITTANWTLYIILGIIGLVLVGVIWWLSKNFRQTFLYQKIANFVKGLWDGVQSVRKVKNIPLFIGHSLFIWLMYFAMIYSCFFTTEATTNLGPEVGLAVLVFGTFGIIATQGGIGAYQLIVAGALTLYGVQYELGYAFSWIAWTTQTLLVLVGGLVALAALPIINREK